MLGFGFVVRHFICRLFLGSILYFRSRIISSNFTRHFGICDEVNQWCLRRIVNGVGNNDRLCRLIHDDRLCRLVHRSRLFHVSGITEVNTFVEYYCLKLRERFVHKFLHQGIGREGDLAMTLYKYPVASIDIHALTVFYVDNPEGTETFHLDKFFLIERLLNDMKHLVDELRSLLLAELPAFGQYIDNLLCRNLSHHSFPPFFIRSFHPILGLKFSTSFGGTSMR